MYVWFLVRVKNSKNRDTYLHGIIAGCATYTIIVGRKMGESVYVEAEGCGLACWSRPHCAPSQRTPSRGGVSW
jgi:hypothetical protein